MSSPRGFQPRATNTAAPDGADRNEGITGCCIDGEKIRHFMHNNETALAMNEIVSPEAAAVPGGDHWP